MKKSHITLIVILTIGITGYIAFDIFQKWHRTEITSSIENERSQLNNKLHVLEDQIADLQSELETEKKQAIPSEKVASVFGDNLSDFTSDKKIPDPTPDCDTLKKSILSYFTYLDQTGYSAKYKLENGTFGYYKNALSLLSKNKPKYAGNSAEILTLLRSMSHFYRVFGKKGTDLITEILKNEPELTEPTMAVFHEWFKANATCNNSGEVPSLNVLYEYSYFFIDTLPGKSYLLRRDPTARILTTYYAILTIKRANDETQNHYGLDIKPHIKLLYDEINNTNSLIYKQKYLNRLKQISENSKE